MTCKQSELGQVLVEMIVAITLGLTGLLAIVALMTHTQKLSRDTRGELQASFLAVEGIEIVKNLIDTDIARGNIAQVRPGGNWNATVTCTPGSFEIDYTTKVSSEGACPGRASGLPLTFSPDRLSGGYRHAGPGADTAFYRQISVSQPSADEIRVTSQVDWVSRGEPRRVVLEDIFKNWRR